MTWGIMAKRTACRREPPAATTPSTGLFEVFSMASA
jgi:hypothetical protein